MQNLENYKYDSLIKLRDKYFDSIEYDEENKGYRDPKFPHVLLKRK